MMRLKCDYSKNVHLPELISSLADEFASELPEGTMRAALRQSLTRAADEVAAQG
jgi:hypothetical protein